MNMNPMIINQINPKIMNQMNNMIGYNQQLLNRGREISLTIKTNDNVFYIKCFENDKVSILREKCNIIGGIFTYKYQPIDENLTLKEYVIKYNSSYIEVKNNNIGLKNILFQTTLGIINITLNYDCPLGIALSFFFIKYNDPLFLQKIFSEEIKYTFSYNAEFISIKDKTPIGEIFRGIDNPNIIVNFINFNISLI